MAERKEKLAPAFTHLNNVASAQNGAKILFATDDFFALAENLIQDTEPVWKETEYTEYGKWMDGWETRRKRIPGHDFCIIKLAYPAVIAGVEVNTAYFTGNHAPKISIQASKDDNVGETIRKAVLGSAADKGSVESLKYTEGWEEIVPMSVLQPGYADSCRMWFHVQSDKTWQLLRLNLFPDGGVARLRVYGHIKNSVDFSGNALDLIAFENGGEVVAFSDAHFGHPRNLLKPGRGLGMADGWETARRLDRPPVLTVSDGNIQYKGSEWCIIKTGISGKVNKIEVDTKHFKGNYPDSIIIEGGVLTDNIFQWTEILHNQKLKANERHFFDVDCDLTFTHIRLTVIPDGGISRLRVIGHKI